MYNKCAFTLHLFFLNTGNSSYWMFPKCMPNILIKHVKERDSKKKPKHWNINVYLFVLASKHMLIHIKKLNSKCYNCFLYFAIPMYFVCYLNGRKIAYTCLYCKILILILILLAKLCYLAIPFFTIILISLSLQHAGFICL